LSSHSDLLVSSLLNASLEDSNHGVSEEDLRNI